MWFLSQSQSNYESNYILHKTTSLGVESAKLWPCVLNQMPWKNIAKLNNIHTCRAWLKLNILYKMIGATYMIVDRAISIYNTMHCLTQPII